jgi:cytochrome c oxidase subunit 2
MTFCFLIYFFNIFSFCDAPNLYQMTVQDPATEIFESMINFYDLLCFDLIIIISVIFTLLLSILFNPIHHSNSKRTFSHSTDLEIFWTVLPALLLITIAYPSFTLLYAIDDLSRPALSLKIVGHQWYWSYELYNMYENCEFSFDSYMLDSSDLNEGQFRLLEVDNRLYLPIKTHIRLLITSADVLHSWAVPSFGIKVDACPGRLNQASLFIKRVGIYYGQCSEICGINHGFMPIVVVGLMPEHFVYRLQYMTFCNLLSTYDHVINIPKHQDSCFVVGQETLINSRTKTLNRYFVLLMLDLINFFESSIQQKPHTQVGLLLKDFNKLDPHIQKFIVKDIYLEYIRMINIFEKGTEFEDRYVTFGIPPKTRKNPPVWTYDRAFTSELRKRFERFILTNKEREILDMCFWLKVRFDILAETTHPDDKLTADFMYSYFYKKIRFCEEYIPMCVAFTECITPSLKKLEKQGFTLDYGALTFDIKKSDPSKCIEIKKCIRQALLTRWTEHFKILALPKDSFIDNPPETFFVKKAIDPEFFKKVN